MTRLGLIIPSSNTTMEPEFYKMIPRGFTVHASRIKLREVTAEGLAEMEEKTEEEAQKLADAGVDVIAYGCTSGSLLRGVGHDEAIEKKIQSATGLPAVATSGAVVKALKALGVRKVAVATPYIDEINALEERFLASNGFEVVDLRGLGIRDNIEIGRLRHRDAYRLVKGLRCHEAEGVFVSCTNFPTIGTIRRLEEELGRPVITSNTATLWAMLRSCHVSIGIEGFGRLLEGA